MKKALQTPSKSVPMSNIQHQSSSSAFSVQRSKLTKIFYLLVIMLVKMQTSYGQVTISSDDVWNNLTYVNTNYPGWQNGIIIDNNISLTIDGIALNFNGTGYILVNSGSKLNVDNSDLSSGVAGYWEGIKSIGNVTINNYTVEPSFVPPNIVQYWSGVKNNAQTKIIIKNNSIIQNCEKALTVGTGTIVEANNSIFKNCWIFYSNVNPLTNPSYYPKSHASHFMDCDFIWDNNMNTASLGQPNRCFNMESVFGINIGGCKFENSRSAVDCIDGRGIGVYADLAGVFIGESGNSDCTDDIGCPANCYNNTPGNGCQFNNLSFGIIYKNGYNQNYSFLCRRNSFSNNYISIQSFDSRNTKIYKNTFTADRTSYSDLYNTSTCGASNNYNSSLIIKFIEFTNGNTYEVYDNTFNYNSNKIYYIHSLGNSTTNINFSQRIQKNTFNNSNPQTINTDNVIGIYAAGKTPQMGIFCNTFNNMGVDIEVSPNGSVKSIMSNNGKAGNVFSVYLPNRFRLRNFGPTINYHFAGSNVTSNREAPFNSPISIGYTPTPSASEGACDLTCTDFQTGIKEIEFKKLFNLYPNPTSSTLNLKGDNLIESIVIVNQLGQVVFINSNINEFDFNLNISDYANGLYYLIVNNTEKHIFIKK